MSVKWNGNEVENIDPKPLLEKIMVTFHRYKDQEISQQSLIHEIKRTWNFLEEEFYKQHIKTKQDEN